MLIWGQAPFFNICRSWKMWQMLKNGAWPQINMK